MGLDGSSARYAAYALSFSGLWACSNEGSEQGNLLDASVTVLPDGATLTPDTGSGSWQTPGTDGGLVSTPGALPADVCDVLQRNACVTCHTTPIAGGATFALTMRDHFRSPAKDGSAMAQRVLARIADQMAPMPPASTGKGLVSDSDVATLTAWINGGMQSVQGAVCTGGGSASGTDAGTPNDSTPSWASKPWPEGECEYVLTLGAHGNASLPLAQDNSGYPIPTATTTYRCFYTKVPWGDKKMHALAMRARIETPDDQAHVHHYVVSGVTPGDFGNTSIAGAAPNGDGDHKNCLNPSGATMAVWAPGAINPITYPDDVGVLLPSGNSYLELQVHYNNSNNEAGRLSTTRYDICVTSKLRPQTAGTFWLGYENAFGETLATGQENTFPLDNQGNGVAVGKCSAKTQGRILSVMPHMHGHGTRAKFEIIRKNGTAETVFERPYNFLDEGSVFRENLTVEQGDVVRTTCQWDTSPVYFGTGTNNEMCFFYTLAYPIELFKPALGEGGVVGGQLACAHSWY